MSKDLNQCNFIGRLGKDVDLKYMPNGNAVANFSIACGDDYKDKNSGERMERTNWVNIVVFGKLAEICGQYLKKGSKVFISGKFQTRKWQDQAGADRYSTEIVVDINGTMQMLDSKPGNGQAKAASQAAAYQGASGGSTKAADPAQQAAPAAGENDFYDDDIPF